MVKWCFQDTENVFNDIVVNKLKTVDPTYLSKFFYLLNLGVYLYHKKNSHTSNSKLIIKKKKKKVHDELYSLIIIHKIIIIIINKKVIYRFYTLLFVFFFLNLKNRKSPKQFLFYFIVFWKSFLKVGAKYVKNKNYYLKTSFKFNSLKIVFILFWIQKQKSSIN